MATVDKKIADKVIEGNGLYPGDHVRVVRIVQYTNAWGGESYGMEYEGELGKYAESPYVQNPRVYWRYR